MILYKIHLSNILIISHFLRESAKMNLFCWIQSQWSLICETIHLQQNQIVIIIWILLLILVVYLQPPSILKIKTQTARRRQRLFGMSDDYEGDNEESLGSDESDDSDESDESDTDESSKSSEFKISATDEFNRDVFMRVGDYCKNLEENIVSDRKHDYNVKHVPSMIPSDSVVYIRLDGKNFGKFSNTFRKPYDPVLAKTFYDTVLIFMKQWRFDVAYFQSDEISFIRKPVYDKHGNLIMLPFNGRLQKLLSVWCSSFTATFNRHLTENITKYGSNDTAERKKLMILRDIYKPLTERNLNAITLEDRPVVFDLRLCSCSLTNARLQVLWRYQDCIRNAKSGIAQFILPRERVHGLSSKAIPSLLNKMAQEHNIDLSFDDLPIYYRLGTLIVRSAKTNFVENEWKLFEQVMDEYTANNS